MDNAAFLRIKFTPLLSKVSSNNIDSRCCIEIVPELSGIQNLDKIDWKSDKEIVEYKIPMTYKITIKKQNLDLQNKVYHSCVDLLPTYSTSNIDKDLASGDVNRVKSDNMIMLNLRSCNEKYDLVPTKTLLTPEEKPDEITLERCKTISIQTLETAELSNHRCPGVDFEVNTNIKSDIRVVRSEETLKGDNYDIETNTIAMEKPSDDNEIKVKTNVTASFDDIFKKFAETHRKLSLSPICSVNTWDTLPPGPTYISRNNRLDSHESISKSIMCNIGSTSGTNYSNIDNNKMRQNESSHFTPFAPIYETRTYLTLKFDDIKRAENKPVDKSDKVVDARFMEPTPVKLTVVKDITTSMSQLTKINFGNKNIFCPEDSNNINDSVNNTKIEYVYNSMELLNIEKHTNGVNKKQPKITYVTKDDSSEALIYKPLRPTPAARVANLLQSIEEEIYPLKKRLHAIQRKTMPSNIGEQLVKSLSFEVEAIPQDNAVEVKKTTNMTPLNVKVRVRKKDDGHSLMRKGIISVPRNDQPDRQIERLRLASSDQTIMSFDMVLEADLEKKAARKSKKKFFGICLGVQDDDDDNQYLPSTANIDQDSRSDTGVMKLKNVRPVTDDIISSNSSRKKDKIFGKCKPGGCLDPPFGEDRYAYQPQPLRSKAPATAIDDTATLDLKKQTSDVTTGKISLKKKRRVDSTSANAADDQNQDKSILSLYQGESGAAVKENDSESIITYPTGISNSGLLLADEKNVARKTSGARNSRKSFNEFSSNEYFSPPRASRDNSRSDRDKNLLTKELLPPRDNKALSPTRLRHVAKSGSKDLEHLETGNTTTGLKEENLESNNNIAAKAMMDDSLVQNPVLRTTSEGLISELFSDLENETDRKTWNKTTALSGKAGAAAAGLVGAAAAGLVAGGLVIDAKKETVEPGERIDNLITDDIKSQNIDSQHFGSGLKLTAKTSDDEKVGAGIPLEQTLLDNSVNQSTIAGSKNMNNNPENQGNTVSKGDLISKGTDVSGRSAKEITPVESQIQDSNLAARRLETTGDSERNLANTGTAINQNTGGQLASTDMEIIGDSQRNFTPLKHQMYDDSNENRDSSEIYDPVSSSQKMDLKDSKIKYLSSGGSLTKSNDMDTTLKEDFLSVRKVKSDGLEHGAENKGKTNQHITYTDAREIAIPLGPENNSQHTVEIAHSGIIDDFVSVGMTTVIGSETGYTQKSGEIYKGSEEKIPGNYEASSFIRRAMSDSVDRGSESRAVTMNKGSEREVPSVKSTNTVKTSSEMETNDRLLTDITPTEIRLSEGSQDILKLTTTNASSTASTVKGEHLSRESIRSRPTYTGVEGEQLYLDHGTDALSTKTEDGRFDKRMPLKGARTTNDDQGASWPEKSDASVTSDIIKSPSDIISQYRENKTLIQSPVVGVDIQPTENTLEQAGRKLNDLGDWGRDEYKGEQFSSSVRISPHDSSGYRETPKSATGTSHSREENKGDQFSSSIRISPHDSSGYRDTPKSASGTSHSRESIFLNLAFQTYLVENQTAVKTLDSSQDQDLNNVILVKSLLQAQDKKGITVPLDSKNVMNILIKPAPPVQNNKSKSPKSISKGSGKSDYSNSTTSLRNIGSDPHAALSSIFHQELVPLQSVIKSLKDEIDSLAAQQMMLRNKLELGTTRSKSFVAKKCCCPKRSLYKN